MSINLTGASSTPNPATLPEGVLKKHVSFCADCPVTEVVEITHEYPYDYFYSSFDMEQFRREVSLERKWGNLHDIESGPSSVERVLNLASSSMMIAIICFGLKAAGSRSQYQ